MRHNLCWKLMGTLLLILGISTIAVGQAQPIHITDGPRVEGTSAHTAVIAWTTNTRGSSIVHYGSDPNSLNQTAESPYTQQGQTHRVQIKNLQPNTTYYFKVDSGQGYGTGTDSQSQVGQFQTKAMGASASAAGQGDEAGEKAENVRITDGPRIEGVSNDSAMIAWTTNAASSSVVHYGTSPNALTQTAQSPYVDNDAPGAHQTHRVRIQNLQPGTTYYFVVDSGQGEGTGTESRSQVSQFQTKSLGSSANIPGRGNEAGERAENVKIVDGPRIESVGNDWAEIAWTTNEASSSVIHYGTDRNALTQTAQSPYVDNDAPGAHQTHRVRIQNLQPNTTYYFVVDSGQGEGTGTRAMGMMGQFTTK